MRFQIEKFVKRYGSGLDWRIVDMAGKCDVSAHETEGEARRVAARLETAEYMKACGWRVAKQGGRP